MGSLHPRSARWGLALLLLSAPCWWIGAFAFFPILGQIYTLPDSAAQLRTISNHHTAWLAQNLCFLLGLVAAAVGLAVLTPMLRNTRGWRFAELGLLATMAASVFGVAVVYNALTWADRQTPEAAPMYAGTGANRLHMAFGVLTLVGFICYGMALTRAGRLMWTGVATMLLSSAMLVEVVRRGDAFPPLFFYTVPFLLGVRLLIRLAQRQGTTFEEGA